MVRTQTHVRRYLPGRARSYRRITRRAVSRTTGAHVRNMKNSSSPDAPIFPVPFQTGFARELKTTSWWKLRKFNTRPFPPIAERSAARLHLRTASLLPNVRCITHGIHTNTRGVATGKKKTRVVVQSHWCWLVCRKTGSTLREMSKIAGIMRNLCINLIFSACIYNNTLSIFYVDYV